ncbi:LysR family transcriptional regulator [Roseibium sediminicola]|uniref:LysR family transcriptional regulator n=1 Tax=Roseibium sediminicola TaxID=2933272 RepID=A0ABT0GVJ5_9HYPH|nr:LysR family transcriptional regulator [Roseibium sp. CAU 1639]
MTDWDDYRFFLSIAQTGNVSGASRRLGVNHSTVSRRLHQLESRLGVRLFDRTPGEYTLTEAGDTVLEAALAARKSLAEAQERVLARDTRLSGTLKFSAPEHLLQIVVLPKLGAFQDRYPDILLRIEGQDDIVSLQGYDADIALRVTRRPAEGLAGHKLADKAVALYASRSYIEKVGGLTGFAAYPAHLWLGDEPSDKRPAWVDAHFYQARRSVQVTSSDALHIAARSGLGIAELPCRVGDVDPDLCRVPPMRARKDSELWLLYRRDLESTARLNVFREFLTNMIILEQDLFDGSRADASLDLT